MTNEQCGMPGHQHSAMCCHKKHISWSAIIAGALVGVGLTFILNLFCVAIGLSLATTNKEGMTVLAIGGFIGLIIGIIAVMFTSGFTAGFLGRPFCMKRNLGVVYGFTSWVLALIFTVLLAASIGRYLNFYSDFVSNSHGNPTMLVIDVTGNHAVTNMPAPSRSQPVMSPEMQAAANSLGISSFLVFVLFFIGAFSSCLGGHCGMTCRCKDDDIHFNK